MTVRKVICGVGRTYRAVRNGEYPLGIRDGMLVTEQRVDRQEIMLCHGNRKWGPFAVSRLTLVGWVRGQPVCLGYPWNDAQPFAVTYGKRLFGPYRQLQIQRFLKIRNGKPLFVGDNPQSGLGIYSDEELILGHFPGAWLLPQTARNEVQMLVCVHPKSVKSKLELHTIRF